MLSERTIENAKSYCCEDISLIENYQEAVSSTEQWVCHHRWEISSVGIFSMEYLISIGLYYKRPATELMFMRRLDHRRMHTSLNKRGEKNHNWGKHRSDETKQKISDTQKGKQNEGSKKVNEKRKTPIQAFRDGVLVGTFESQTEAARRLGCYQGNIGKVLNGKRHQHRGYTFRRAS